jgi:hypothetical protein
LSTVRCGWSVPVFFFVANFSQLDENKKRVQKVQSVILGKSGPKSRHPEEKKE